MIISTTPTLEGRAIREYRGIVSGEAILGASVFSDILASVTDVVGGRSATYERELGLARKFALEGIARKAADLGANAIVGVDIDYEVLGANNGMLMVSATGTAVVI
jgi:uncharacterized protein YbjQ (UPF0145 family)